VNDLRLRQAGGHFVPDILRLRILTNVSTGEEWCRTEFDSFFVDSDIRGVGDFGGSADKTDLHPFVLWCEESDCYRPIAKDHSWVLITP